MIVECGGDQPATGQAFASELDSRLCSHALLSERMFHQRHLGHKVRRFDQCLGRVAAGDDDVGHLGPSVDDLQHFVEVLDAHLRSIHQDENTGELRDKTPAEQTAFDYGLKLRDLAIKLTDQLGDPKGIRMSEHIATVMREKKHLNANVDFYSATVYYSLGVPTDLFTPIFAISRTAGWTAHVLEQLADNRLYRPLSEYTGPEVGKVVKPIDQR